MDNPPSIRLMFQVLDIVGLLNLERPKNKLRILYNIVQYSIIFFYFITHFYSTVTRSYKEITEFIQCLLEDAFISNGFIGLLLIYFKYQSMHKIMTYMETLFCVSDKTIINKYTKKANIVYGTIMFSLFLALSSCVTDTINPREDIEYLRNIYGTKYPERKLIAYMRFPYVDETESGYYHLFYIIQLYSISLICIAYSVYLSLIPVIIIHLEGQYKLLSMYTEQLGKKIIDLNGNQIFYINIRTNQFVVDTENRIFNKNNNIITVQSSSTESRDVSKSNKQFYEEYEAFYFKQLIQFHKKLLIFQVMVCIL